MSATFFNNIAVGCVLLGLIGPVATGKLAHVFTHEFVYSEAAAWVLAAAFHMIARRQLRFLAAGKSSNWTGYERQGTASYMARLSAGACSRRSDIP